MIHPDVHLETPSNSFYLPKHRKGYVPANPRSRSRLSTPVLFLLISLTVLTIYIVLIKTGLFIKILEFCFHKLQELYKEDPALFLLTVFFSLFLLMVLGLPCQTWICLFCTLIVKDNYFNFFFLTMTSFVSSLFIYIAGRRLLCDWLLVRVEDNAFYRVLRKESTKRPWRSAFLTRLVYLPTGLKEYILVLSNNPFKSFAVSSLIVHGIYIAELLMVCSEIEEVRELFKGGKKWGDKGIGEKVGFVFVLFLVGLTVALMGYLSYLTTKQVEKREKMMKEQASVINMSDDLSSLNN